MNVLRLLRTKWVLRVWLACAGLVGLTLFTPLEFVPLPLENAPRWGLWALAVPACGLLRSRWPRLRGLWTAVPWLLWGPVVAATLLWALATPETRLWSHRLRPVKTLFADDGEWRTSQVVFRRGRQRVVNQQRTALDQPAPRSLPWQTRTVLITQLGPGLQWAGSDPGPHGLDASWRAAEPTQPGEFLRWELFRQQLALSGDSAVHRRLRARLQVHARAVWRRQRDAWRTRVGPPRPDAPETVPAASHAGANTLGCWVSADGPVATEGVRYRVAPRRGHDCRADYRTDTTATDASRHRLTVEATLLLNGVAHELRLYLAVPLRRGTYALQACAEPASWSTLQLFDPWHNVSYCSQSQPRATVVLSHIDTLRRIVAGTFEGELQTNATPRQYVVLRQGRFDVRY